MKRNRKPNLERSAETESDSILAEMARIFAAGFMRLRHRALAPGHNSTPAVGQDLDVSPPMVLSGERGHPGQNKRADQVLVTPSRLSPQTTLY